MRVAELELDVAVSDSDFRVEERPNMLIAKRQFGKPINPIQPRILEADEHFYRVNDNGTRVEVVIDQGVERRRWSSLWWLLGLAPVAALAAWLVYRWRALKRLAPGKGENHARTTS